MLGEYFLLDNIDEYDDDIAVSRETRTLILDNLVNQCDCVQHKQKHFSKAQSPQVSDKMLGRRKSYIRVSSPDQCSRNI